MSTLAAISPSSLLPMYMTYVHDISLYEFNAQVFLVPPHLAVPFVSTTGFVWVLALSMSRGKER